MRGPGGEITAFDAPLATKEPNSDARNIMHGFVRAAGGSIIMLDAPGAGINANQGTVPQSINAAGAIAGTYTDAARLAHGFVRAANGTITTFDAPGAGTNTSA